MSTRQLKELLIVVGLDSARFHEDFEDLTSLIRPRRVYFLKYKQFPDSRGLELRIGI